MNTILIKGIPGQSRSQPVPVMLTSFVKQSVALKPGHLDYDSLFDLSGYVLHKWDASMCREEERASETELTQWKLVVSRPMLKANNIPLERIVECLAKEVKLPNARDWSQIMSAQRVDELLEESSQSQSTASPIADDIEFHSRFEGIPSYEALLVKSKRCPLLLMQECSKYLQSNLQTANENVFVYVHIKSLGINLSAICCLPFVDTTTSSSINVHVMSQMFGIGNAMMSHVRTIQGTFDYTNQSFHPARVQMMCDHLSTTGQFHGVDHTGMAKREDGFITQASLERSAAVFTKYSLGGSEESTDYISPSTIFGSKPRLGVGMNDIKYVVSKEDAPHSSLPEGTTVVNNGIVTHAMHSFKPEEMMRHLPGGKLHIGVVKPWVPDKPTTQPPGVSVTSTTEPEPEPETERPEARTLYVAESPPPPPPLP